MHNTWTEPGFFPCASKRLVEPALYSAGQSAKHTQPNSALKED